MGQILILIFIVSLLACPLISFRYSSSKYKNHGISKLKAFFYFLFISSLPILLFIILNLVLIVVEELTVKSIISGLSARSFIIVIFFGLLLLLNVSIIFAVYLRKINRDKNI